MNSCFIYNFDYQTCYCIFKNLNRTIWTGQMQAGLAPNHLQDSQPASFQGTNRTSRPIVFQPGINTIIQRLPFALFSSSIWLMTGKERPGCLRKQPALQSRLLISDVPEKELISWHGDYYTIRLWWLRVTQGDITSEHKATTLGARCTAMPWVHRQWSIKAIKLRVSTNQSTDTAMSGAK